MLLHVAYGQTYISIGYSGAYMTHPGLETSLIRSLKSKDTQKSDNNTDLRVGGSMGFYFQKNRHTALYLGTTIEWLHTSSTGFQWGLNLPLGFMKTFLPNVYEVNGSSIESVKGVGPSNFYFMPGMRLGRTMNRGFIDEWFIRNKFLIVPGHPLQRGATFLLEISIVKKINTLIK
jgi:hypothetical protein